MTRDFFAEKAPSYEQNPSRVANVENIARAVLERIDLDPSMEVLDFGSGTGLLLERVAPYVGKITAVDVSEAMNAQLEAKRARLGCELEILQLDLEGAQLDRQFDAIISSMTLHHVHDVTGMFASFHRMLRPGGFLAIADLDEEDGTFHAEDTGVHHPGFERRVVIELATAAGFEDVEVTTASVVKKPQGDFPVFLLTAKR